MSLTYEDSQYPRERSRTPRVPGADTAVAGNHHPWLPVERSLVRGRHRLHDDARFHICGIPFTNDAGECFGWGQAERGGQFCQRFLLIARLVAQLGNVGR